MPNKRAKERKRKRRLKNTELSRSGRTANQVKRKRKLKKVLLIGKNILKDLIRKNYQQLNHLL